MWYTTETLTFSRSSEAARHPAEPIWPEPKLLVTIRTRVIDVPHPTLSRARRVVRLRSIHGKPGADRGRAAPVVRPRVQPRRALPPGGGDGLAASTAASAAGPA